MGSVFDENSEFLEYLNNKKKDQEGDLQDSNLSQEELYFKASPFDLTASSPKEAESKESPNYLASTSNEEHTELHIHDKQDKETFTLNLKKHEIKAPQKIEESPQPKLKIAETPKSKEILSTPPSEDTSKLAKLNSKTTWQDFIWDKISFLGTTLAIFLVFFFALNWSAYYQILSNKYQDYTGQIAESPLQSFTSDSSDNPSNDENPLLLPTEVSNSPFAVNHFSIPAIDLDVVPPGTRIIIPRINKNVPVINVSDDKLIARDWSSLEADIQDSLKDGVVHYPGTPWPDQSGNVVLTGHSSYYPWDPGRFKDVFALLHNVEVGDEVIIFYKQKRYTYIVSDLQVVLPSEVNVLGDSGDDRITLITCTPIGTNLKRLIVTAKPLVDSEL